MRVRAALIIALLAAIAAPSAGKAQGIIPGPGAPVRVARSPSRLIVREGTLLRLAGDSVLMISGAADTARYLLSDTLRLEIPIGVSRKTWQGAVIGAVAGTLAGGILALALYEEPNCSSYFCIDRGGAAVLGATFGGMVGGGLGALAGAAKKTPIWGVVDRTGPQAMLLRPRGGGVGLGVSLSF